MDNKRTPSLLLALLPILAVIIMGLATAFKLKSGMFIPLISGIIVASLVGIYLGFRWDELEKGLVAGVARALQPIFIIIIVGSIIGSWIAGGIVPIIIYYSLKFINPAIFIPAASVAAAAVGLATGSSASALGTIGLALMVAGAGMGFPAPLVAAAIICGAYMGDKLSPLSDTTNLAPALAGCTLFEHIGHMMWDTVPAFFLSLIAFYFVGIEHAASLAGQMDQIQTIILNLETNFNLTPFLFIPPLVTIYMAFKKYPAVPSLLAVSVLGGLCSMIFQGANVAQVFNAMTFGFSSNTGNEMLDKLLSAGGILSMSDIIIIFIIATALGGILETAGCLTVILNSTMKKVKTNGQLMLATLFSVLAVGFATGVQLLAIVIPARMFAPIYKERKLHAKNLSRATEAAGTVGINLIPWSLPALFAKNILGVDPYQYIPYLYFVFLVIIINGIYGYTGISIAKINDTASNVINNGNESIT